MQSKLLCDGNGKIGSKRSLSECHLWWRTKREIAWHIWNSIQLENERNWFSELVIIRNVSNDNYTFSASSRMPRASLGIWDGAKKWNKWISFKEWKMFVNLIDKHVEWQRNIHSDSERKWQKNKIFRELATCQWLYVHTLILIDFSHEVMWLLFLAFIFFLCLWEMNHHIIGSSHSIYVFVWIYDLLQLRGQWWWHRTNLQNVVLSVLFSLSMGW